MYVATNKTAMRKSVALKLQSFSLKMRITELHDGVNFRRRVIIENKTKLSLPATLTLLPNLEA